MITIDQVMERTACRESKTLEFQGHLGPPGVAKTVSAVCQTKFQRPMRFFEQEQGHE